MKKRLIDILPKISQWESIEYADDFNCPHCDKSGFFDGYGEEIGLDKPWEPDWKDGDTHKFNIHVIKDEIRCGVGLVKSDLLSFPTEEMRDTYYENFKEWIEECKELL